MNVTEINLWKSHSGGSVGGTTMFMMNAEHDVIITFAINRSNAQTVICATR